MWLSIRSIFLKFLKLTRAESDEEPLDRTNREGQSHCTVLSCHQEENKSISK